MWLLKVLSSVHQQLLCGIEKNAEPSSADNNNELWSCFILKMEGKKRQQDRCCFRVKKRSVWVQIKIQAVCSHINLAKGYVAWLDPSLSSRRECVGVASGLMWLTLHAHTSMIAQHACILRHTRANMHTPCSNIISCLRILIKGVLSLSLQSEVTWKIPAAK